MLIGFGVLLLIGCFITSCVVLSEIYVKRAGIKNKIPNTDYPGVALLIQAISIIMATASMRYARASED